MKERESKKYFVVERRTWKSTWKIFFRFFISDTLNSFLLICKRKKRYAFDASIYKGVNLGSSTTSPTGWIGISGGITIFFLNLPKLFLRLAFPFSARSRKMKFNEFYQQTKKVRLLHHNLFFSIPFNDEVVPFLFSSHFFEHLTYDSARFLIAESYRVLKPGGYIRIVVPALEDEVEKMKFALKAYADGDVNPVQNFVTTPYDESSDSFSHHRYMYNEKSLSEALLAAGFVNVNKKQKGEGALPDLDQLETIHGLTMEAQKPIHQ